MPALGDIIIDALIEFLRTLFEPVKVLIQDNADSLVKTVIGTPHPDAVFNRPTNGAWPELYDYYWETMIPLSLFLWALSIGLVVFLESTSHLFSSYHRSKLKKRAFSGLLGIMAWWWLAAISLRFIEALTGFLVPNLSDVSLFETLSFSTIGVLGVVISLASDLVLFLLIALLYFMRQIALYLYVPLMPILIVFWIPGVGPFSLVSRFMKQLAGFYVPFLFMTVPVALLFRIGNLLGDSFELSMGGIGAWLTALVIPIVAVASPFVLFWQAGALFFMADRASYHLSSERAKTRVVRTRERGGTSAQGGRNFLRGLRGQQAVLDDGQMVFDSGDSRAHTAGKRLNATGSRLRARFTASNGQGENPGGSTPGAGTSETSDRTRDFGNLRNRPSSVDQPPPADLDGGDDTDHSQGRERP